MTGNTGAAGPAPRRNAIGVLETAGYVAALAAADAMLKAADVALVSREVVATGRVSVTVGGDVGAVQAAAEAGIEAAAGVGELLAAHVIPLPESSVGDHFATAVRPPAATADRTPVELPPPAALPVRDPGAPR